MTINDTTLFSSIRDFLGAVMILIWSLLGAVMVFFTVLFLLWAGTSFIGPNEQSIIERYDEKLAELRTNMTNIQANFTQLEDKQLALESSQLEQISQMKVTAIVNAQDLVRLTNLNHDLTLQNRKLEQEIIELKVKASVLQNSNAALSKMERPLS